MEADLELGPAFNSDFDAFPCHYQKILISLIFLICCSMAGFEKYFFCIECYQTFTFSCKRFIIVYVVDTVLLSLLCSFTFNFMLLLPD